MWLGRFMGIDVITTTHPHLSLWRLGVACQVHGDRGDYYNTPSSLSGGLVWFSTENKKGDKCMEFIIF